MDLAYRRLTACRFNGFILQLGRLPQAEFCQAFSLYFGMFG